MNVSISIDFSQIKAVIAQCNPDEKLELLRLLEKDTLATRFNRLLNLVKTDELSLEDITAEVESVRATNYHAR